MVVGYSNSSFVLVPLHDSLDSTGGAAEPKENSQDGKKEPVESADTGTVLPSKAHLRFGTLF